MHPGSIATASKIVAACSLHFVTTVEACSPLLLRPAARKNQYYLHSWQLCSKYSTPDRNISVADSEMNKDAFEYNKILQLFIDSRQKDRVVHVLKENIVES